MNYSADAVARLAADGVNLTTIDDVPVLWIDHPGDRSAVLSFRVGQADEPLTGRGLTHLAEHAALSPFAPATFDLNGATGPSITRFMAAARPETLTTFITSVTENLARLGSAELSDADAEAIRHDAKILEAEGKTRGSSIGTTLMAELYGTTGHGVLEWNELALLDLNLDRFQAWVRRYFTRANAVLTLSFPPPAELRLAALPVGEWMPAPSVAPLVDDTPFYRRRNGPFALLAPVRRSMEAVAFAAIYEQVIQTRLRHEGGMSYAPNAMYWAVSTDHAFISASADSPDGHGTAITAGALESLDRLASDGPSLDELSIYRNRVLHSMDSEYSLRQQLGYVADEVLYRRHDILDNATRHEQLQALTPEGIAEVAAAVRQSMAVSIPRDAQVDAERLPARAEWSEAEVLEGRSYPSKDTHGTGTSQMVLADDGVSLIMEDGNRITMRREDIMAMLRWDDGVRQLVGRDGSSIRLIPSRWYRPEDIREHFERQVSPDDVLHMGLRGAYPDSASPPKNIETAIGFKVFSALITIGCLIGFFATFNPWLIGAAAIFALQTVVVHDSSYRSLLVTQEFDDIDWHLSYSLWKPERPISQAYVVGALKLAWLVDNRLMADWVEEAAGQHLDAYRSGETSAVELYRELGGFLASDMVLPSAAAFFTFLEAPRQRGSRPARRWWNEMGFGIGDDPYAVTITPELVERSHRWFDKWVRGFNILYLKPVRLGPDSRGYDISDDAPVTSSR